MPNKITYTIQTTDTTKSVEYWNPYTNQYQDTNPLTGIPAGTYTGLKVRLKGSNPAIIATYAGSVTVSNTVTPVISGFSPTYSTAGSTVILSGSGFTGVTLVSLNSAAVASFSVDSDTQITAVLTSANTSGYFKATNPNTGTATSINQFTVQSAGGSVPAGAGLYTADFGVKADGITDDTDAMRTAAAAAVSQGKTLYVQPGTIMLRCMRQKNSTTTIGVEMGSGFQMRGMGVGITTFKALAPPSGTTYTANKGSNPTTNVDISNLLYSTGKSNIDISGFSLDGNLAAMPFNPDPYYQVYGISTRLTEMGGVYFEGGSNNRVFNTTATKLGGFGFRWDNSKSGYGGLLAADNCINGACGYTLQSGKNNGCDGSILENFIFQDNHSDQIRMHASYVTVRHGVASFSKICPAVPAAEANFAGIYFACASNCTVFDVTCEGNSSFGIDCHVGPDSSLTNPSDDYYNPQATGGGSIAGQIISFCRFLRNANGGGRNYQYNNRWQNCLFDSNGQRVNNAVCSAYRDQVIYNPSGIHFVDGYGGGCFVTDCTFRNSGSGNQLTAISGEMDASGNVKKWSDVTATGNHVTGQALFAGAKTNVVDTDNYVNTTATPGTGTSTGSSGSTGSTGTGGSTGSSGSTSTSTQIIKSHDSGVGYFDAYGNAGGFNDYTNATITDATIAKYGDGKLYISIPSGVRYEITGVKGQYFGVVNVFEITGSVETQVGSFDESGTGNDNGPVVVYTSPGATTGAITLELKNATGGKSFAFVQVRLFTGSGSTSSSGNSGSTNTSGSTGSSSSTGTATTDAHSGPIVAGRIILFNELVSGSTTDYTAARTQDGSGTLWQEFDSNHPDLNCIFGSGQLSIFNIPAGLNYEIAACKSEYFRTFSIKHDGVVQGSDINLNLASGSGTHAPEVVFTTPAALNGAVTRLDLAYDGGNGAAFSFRQIRFF